MAHQVRGLLHRPRMRFVRELGDLHLRDVALVGGKNASLGEMISALEPAGVHVPVALH